MQAYIIEYCTDSVADARQASEKGINRIELCSALHLDGLSPKISDVENLLQQVNIPIRIMLRPSHQYHISPIDLEAILTYIDQTKHLPIEGYVTGYITKDNFIDEEFLTQIEHHLPSDFKVTFHKAIDFTENLIEAVQQLNQFKFVDCVLSSGAKHTALEGAPQLIEMQKYFNGKIIAAGKITYENLIQHVKLLELQAYHGRNIVQL